MRFRLVVLLIHVMWCNEFHAAAKMVGKQSKQSTNHLQSLEDIPEDTFPATSTNQTKLYTPWSPWTRCMDCVQRRVKTCVSPQCEDSRIYEEKPCGKKRCRRKARQKSQFNIVHLDKDSSHLTRQAPSRIWSKWSSWSPCSEDCRTQRIRICRKPGRCRKKQQEQTAYCYHDNSMCENYVLNLLDNQHDSYEINRYHYNSEDLSRRVPRRKLHRCGQPFRKSRMLKIIGGVQSKKYKWPWHVAILNKYYEVFCGGTLIGPRWVLTASHCIRPYLRVRLNEHDLRARDGRELEMTVYKIFQHPKFNHKTVDNDIALLQLPRAVNIPIACLPDRGPRPTEICTVMGWGKLRASDTYGTHILHEAKLPIVSPNVCRRSYRHFLITSNMLCAGWPSGKADTCAGDSGGGLMCPFKRRSRVAYSIQGITSFGDGCGLRNKYGIYTTVFNYLKWIYYVMDHYS
ncbi:vitamin K-dependent protein C [Zophobas morio]|uniref:vitamin K-dependent protein C n=1 Tax=Zophobas morio TaxID=2755281 RepID=UPI003083DDC6